MNISFQTDNKSMLDSDISALIESQHSSTLSWLRDIRLEAYADYSTHPLPTRKIEHWKYNDMSFLTAQNFETKQTFSLSNEQEQMLSQVILDHCTLCVLVNGQFNSQYSNGLDLDGISVTPFAQARDRQSEIITNLLQSSKRTKNSLTQLNTAICQDGLLIEIEADKKIKHPIYLLHLNTAEKNQQISSNQIVVHCGKNSESQIIEHFISEKSDANQLNLQQTIIQLQENSSCDHYRLNMESANTRQVSRALTKLNKDARFNSFYFSEGSQLNRTDIDIHHQGKNSESHVTGIYLPNETRVIDYHTNIEHQVPNCTSREVFRGIIADSAKATFNGRIHIFKDAQKSDAKLSNKNLLLTNQAEINTKPELEIYADDVVCAHGATIAKIDEKSIYYMQTRGIDSTRAKKMLSVGFINELLNKVTNAPLKQYLNQHIQNCLSDIK